MDVSELVPVQYQEPLAWLGRVPSSWLKAVPKVRNGLPTTDLNISVRTVRATPGYERFSGFAELIDGFVQSNMMVNLCYMEAAARLVSDGPKLFRPTQEQWDSMEHVELRLPVGEFRTPYPAMAVQIPPESRKRLIQEFHVPPDRMPRQVLIRRRKEPGESALIFTMARFGPNELFHMLQDQPPDLPIESLLAERIRPGAFPDAIPLGEWDDKYGYPCSILLARVVMNLCLFLTHYGCSVGPPVDPAAYSKHRHNKKLVHLRHNDYLTINMKQQIVVRKPSHPTENPTGPGTGVESPPHWRRGHWRAYPGQAALRASGRDVPLLFVRPCLVRADRATGDLALSEVEYTGEGGGL